MLPYVGIDHLILMHYIVWFMDHLQCILFLREQIQRTEGDTPGCVRSLEYVRNLWESQGIVPPGEEGKHSGVIFYCGTGWRSSYAWLIATAMGWENVKNYDGGFLHWSTTGENAEQRLQLISFGLPDGPCGR